MTKIDVGDPAPDVTFSTHEGQAVSLADYRGKQPVVLFFYPKDGTPICTKEASAFRDAHEDFLAAGAAVFSVSGDKEENHQRFAAEHRLPFPLVSDTSGELRRRFGVPKSMGLLPGRVTYVIDKAGIIRLIFSSTFAADRHVQEAIEAVRGL